MYIYICIFIYDIDKSCSSFFISFPFSDDYVNQYASSAPKKTDEQSALNRILHETAAWVFVSAFLSPYVYVAFFFFFLYSYLVEYHNKDQFIMLIYLISVMW